MTDILRKIFRKWPKLYKLLSAIYQTVFAPVVSGHAQYYVKYLLFVKRGEVKKLNLYGLVEPKAYNYREWRIGKGKDGAYRRYYLAYYNGKKCFIKIGTNDATVSNELDILSNFKDAEIDFSPKFLVGDFNFANSTVMVAVDFIEGLTKFEIPGNEETFDDICKQFNDILDKLTSNGVVHADIHKGNLMLCNGKLFLLDYGISMIKDKGNKIDYVARPGTFYIKKDGYRIYDDAYSFEQLLNQQGVSGEYKNCINYQNIVKRKGNNVLIVKC